MGWKRPVLLALLLSTGGCYEYHSVRPGDAVLQTRVRATVSPEKAAELAPVMRGVRPEVTGRLVERTGDHLMLEVPIYGASTAGMSSDVLHNRVEVKLDDLVTLETRTLSKWRTAVAIGSVVVAASGTWVALSADNQTGGDKPGTGIDNNLISIIRIPLGLFH